MTGKCIHIQSVCNILPGHLRRGDEDVLSAAAEGVGVQARRVVVRERVARLGPLLRGLGRPRVPLL